MSGLESDMAYLDLRFDRGDGKNRQGLAERVLRGEVFVFREALQAFDLFEMWNEATLRGIAKSVGTEAADRAARDGYHRIHEWVSATDIPPMTDAVYDEVEPLADRFLDRFMKGAFPNVTTYYYERSPNVRFHIPYDLAAAHRKDFNKFAESHGQGKIAAHGPHRDSWLDCAANGMNLWFAMGRVRHGNSLTIYPGNYSGEYKFKHSGDIQDGEKLQKAITFQLEPGDVVMFHTDHVHGSELNRIDETRFVISCRLSIDKPEFPLVHHHHYVYSGWTGSAALKPLAEVPAMLQPSYAKGLFTRTRNKLLPSLREEEPKPNPVPTVGRKVNDHFEVPLADVPVGEVKALSGAFCVARLSEDEVVALTRRCPHASGDLVNGWVDGRNVVCPWHNLPFDADTGRSPCKSLARLKSVACEIRGDTIVVDPKVVLNAEPGDAALATAAE
jgi:nitrite reductase/ring-hydroxylating ferredoxin subunit